MDLSGKCTMKHEKKAKNHEKGEGNLINQQTDNDYIYGLQLASYNILISCKLRREGTERDLASYLKVEPFTKGENIAFPSK